MEEVPAVKIGGYDFPQPSREQRPNLENTAPQTRRTISPLDLETLIAQRKDPLSAESKRLQVQTYLEEVKTFREQLNLLQKEAQALQRAQEKLTAARKTGPGSPHHVVTFEAAAAEVRDELARFYQDRGTQRPELNTATRQLDDLLFATENRDGVRGAYALEGALAGLDDTRRLVLEELEEMQKKMADRMVAMENVTAAQSLIRDEQGAGELLDQLKASLTGNVSRSILSQANLNREHIMRLIG